MTEDALNLLVTFSQGYPYLVQLAVRFQSSWHYSTILAPMFPLISPRGRSWLVSSKLTPNLSALPDSPREAGTGDLAHLRLIGWTTQQPVPSPVWQVALTAPEARICLAAL